MKRFEDDEAKRRLREEQQKAGHARATMKSYEAWVVRYRASRTLRECRDLQTYLDRLSTVEGVNPKTVKHALNALIFYHRRVLGIEIPEKSLKLPRINPHKNVPVWLTHEEAMDILSRMNGLPRLQAELLYGTGSRITALLTLRLKDIDLGRQIVVFRHDKGGKSRSVRIPSMVMPRLVPHVAAMRLQWEGDKARGIICPSPDESLMRKLDRKRFGTLPWYYLFPSAVVRDGERWHATGHALATELERAAVEAGITKRVSPHVFRHSNATALLERGENIRTIQEHLGHTHVETTEIYTHATCSQAVISPMDMAPPVRANIIPLRRHA
jgi:site-specific recombinase XerD